MADSSARYGAVVSAAPEADPTDEGHEDDPIVDDVLVEDVSIDGMCGVY